jgi:hypothetical protein
MIAPTLTSHWERDFVMMPSFDRGLFVLPLISLVSHTISVIIICVIGLVVLKIPRVAYCVTHISAA